MSRLGKAREFRNKIDANLQATRKLIRVDELAPEELDEMIDIFDEWVGNGKTYLKDDKVRWNGKLYRVIKGITTINGLYPPDETPQEYDEILPKEVIPIWKKPQAHNTYSLGAKVIYEPNGKVYISKINNNAEEPTKDEPHNRYWVEE